VRVLAILAIAGCGSSSTSPPSIGVTGTLTIDGEAATPTRCQPGTGAAGVYIQVETTRGHVRFEDTRLYFTPGKDSPDRGELLACTKLDRSWGGGTRADGSSYWRGMLDVACGRVSGRLDIDCGDITAEERAQLDKNRTELREQQKGR
jgi:hypothetical protein